MVSLKMLERIDSLDGIVTRRESTVVPDDDTPPQPLFYFPPGSQPMINVSVEQAQKGVEICENVRPIPPDIVLTQVDSGELEEGRSPELQQSGDGSVEAEEVQDREGRRAPKVMPAKSP